MVTIFKKLREKLLRSGQTRKYLIYAIGEIFLVVIGILIALQVNNWNEQRQHDTEVVNYLTNLKGTLNDDIRSLESAASFNKLRLYGIFYILRNADLNTKKFTDFPWADVSANDGRQSSWEGPYPDTLNREFTDLVFSMIGRGFGTGSFNKSVINELYSTGSYSRIHNKVLKQKIAAYYRYLEQRLEGYAIEEHEEWANETTRFFRDQYGIFTLDTTDLQDPFGLIKGKKDAEHHLRYMALEVNYHIVWCLNAKEKAKELIELIEREVSG
ncbi:DUF6090 family protein [Balneola sp. MJW-20]|uniref:DUF6090 family protein n=1 Tax=Gracilimonas aurantiaca TaxID=3234185 RepID=UPI003466A7D4